MALLDDILTWSETLPDWQRDALRRAFQNDGQLTAQDLADIRAMVERTPGAPKPLPLTKAHIPTAGSGASTSLLGLSDLKHVNGFPDGRQLDLASKGITVVFGENGAGKSGFARVLKRACRARHSSAVLSDAFAGGGKTGAPEAVLAYETNGKATKVQWREGGASDANLAMVSVYDSHCAQDYVSKDGPSAFVPFGFHSLSALAGGQQTLRDQIQQAISAIQLNPAQFAALQGPHAVGQHLAKLGPATDIAALEALSRLTPEETQQIAELAAAIKGLDVEPEATKHERLAQRLDPLAVLAARAESFVVDKALDKFAGLAQTELAATRADRRAQEILRGADAPDRPADALLPETGGTEWKILFQAAEAFSQKAYPAHKHHPASGTGDQCVLCQQPLADNASARMDRFREYVAADAAKNLAEATEAVATARQKIDAANLTPVDDPTLADIRHSNPELAAAVTTHQAAWASRRQWLDDAYIFDNWDAPRPPLPQGDALSTQLTAAAHALRSRATQLRGAKDQTKHQQLSTALATLTARQALGAHLPALKAHVDQTKRRQALSAAHTALNPQGVSAKITSLSKTHTTDALATALNDELKALGYRHRVKPSLTSQTRGGRNIHGLVLAGSSHSTHDVLSEGEQRAIALAFFLAEARLRDDTSTIVFDDPSTSLDHVYRRRMATHLVKLSQSRPVVILTHDAVFLTTLLGEIAEHKADNKIQTIEWDGGKPGGCREGLAWENKPYDDQLKAVKAACAAMLANHNPLPNDADKRAMRDAYGLVRGMIERAIRDVVLNGTVHPFSDEVRVIQAGAIAGFDIEEWRVIVSVYGKASETIAAHDSPAAGQYEMPAPQEFEQDLAAVEKVMEGCIARRKAFNNGEKKFIMELRSKIREK